MRMNVYTNKGVLERARSGKGGTLEDFLVLISEPLVVDDAATKRFVDDRFANLPIDSITSGVFAGSQLPAMSGDVISDAGSTQVHLRPFVSAGNVVTPQVNAKGLVTGGGVLSDEHLPDLDWSVVQSGHPTDVIGYGIGDAISDTGGAVTVNITLSGPPTQSTHAATKAYVDTASLAGGGGGVGIGDIMLKITNTSPIGYLQCNGAMVSKTAYAALYAVMGDSYDSRIVTGAGKPWQQQFNININNQINFNSPVAGTALAATTAFGEVAVTKNKIYILGGSNGTNSNVIQSATIGEDGAIGAWTNSGLTLPSGMKNFQVAVTKNFLYLLSGVGAGNSTNFIYRSPIDATGTLGNWQTDGSLPLGVSGHQVFLTASRMYVIGGSVDGGANAISTVHYTDIAADGSLGSWTAGPILPISLQHARLAVTKGRVYLIGGHTGTVVIPNLIYGNIDDHGVITGWTTSTVLPTSAAMGHTVVTDKYVYYMGGTVNNDLSGATGNIYRAPIAVDGGIGSWELMSGTCAIKGGHVVSLRNRISVIGGLNAAGTYLNTTVNYLTNNAGAPNDYSSYYTTAVFSPDTTVNFQLPDLSFAFIDAGKYFVKY